MSDPPALPELQAVAERALAHAEGELQATATWEDGRLTVELTCVLDGRAAVAQAAGTDEEALRRAARAAALHARRPRAWPTPGLPDPDPVVDQPAAPSAAGAGDATEVMPAGVELSVRTCEVLVAVASTKGVRAAQRRGHAVAEATATAPGRTIRLRATAAHAAQLPLEELVAEAARLRCDGREPLDLPREPLPLVFGPDAVATILEHLRPAFGVELDLGSGLLHGRLGTPVAAPAVELTTPAGGFDAEGVPRQAVGLIVAGVAAARVHDTASAARGGTTTTGHATRAAALAPSPADLVLGLGDAPSVEALCGPLARGLFVPALSRAREAHGDAFRHTTRGAVLIEAGALTDPVRDGPMMIEPLALLARVEALGAGARPVPLPGRCAALVPPLRASAG